MESKHIDKTELEESLSYSPQVIRDYVFVIENMLNIKEKNLERLSTKFRKLRQGEKVIVDKSLLENCLTYLTLYSMLHLGEGNPTVEQTLNKLSELVDQN